MRRVEQRVVWESEQLLDQGAVELRRHLLGCLLGMGVEIGSSRIERALSPYAVDRHVLSDGFN